MKNVKRYTCGVGDGMFESKEGHYVDYADYKLLLAKYSQALSKPDAISIFCQCKKPDWCMEDSVCGVCNKDIKIKRQNHL